MFHHYWETLSDTAASFTCWTLSMDQGDLLEGPSHTQIRKFDLNLVVEKRDILRAWESFTTSITA